MEIQGYNFEGPYSTSTNFNAVAGVYLITTSSNKIIDVGETDNLKERIPNHERRQCWENNDATSLWFHHESNRENRLSKEKKIRLYYDPVCGID